MIGIPWQKAQKFGYEYSMFFTCFTFMQQKTLSTQQDKNRNEKSREKGSYILGFEVLSGQGSDITEEGLFQSVLFVLAK